VTRANELGIRFVGGHPMAGRERSGVDAATADLFVDRPWVLVPGAASGDADVARASWLATAVGARPIEMTAEDHDRAVAAISHLPLVAAAALVEAIVGERWTAGNDPARELAASGWVDMTRLARGDPEMGAGILATNAAEVAGQVRALRDVLDRWLEALEAEKPDADDIRHRLREARDRLGRANP
jgi:prephenate dehydrogenase